MRLIKAGRPRQRWITSVVLFWVLAMFSLAGAQPLEASILLLEDSTRSPPVVQPAVEPYVFALAWGSPPHLGAMNEPAGIAVAPDGSVWVADTLNHRIQAYDAYGQFLRQWGSRGRDEGQFDAPYGLTVAPDGAVYVAAPSMSI